MATETGDTPMPLDDSTSMKYLPGISDAIKRLMGPKEAGWSTVYGDQAAVEQAIRQAYHAGRIDGLAEALRPAAPGAPETPEETLETLDAAWERLGLFEAHSAAPGPISAVLAVRPPLTPLPGDPRVWLVAQARLSLGLSLAEGMEFVKGVFE